MTSDNSLATHILEKQTPVYCASRVFSPLDRIGGASLAMAVEEVLKGLFNEPMLKTRDLVFLPFRDTDQNSLIGSDRSRKIYEMDILNLRRCSALFARFDGLSKDSGIALEIGYAYGMNIPIAILFTDFIWEGLVDSDHEWTADPIIQTMSNIVLRFDSIPRDNKGYLETNLSHEREAIKKFVRTAFRRLSVGSVKNRFPPQNGTRSAYVDMMGGRYEWSQDAVAKIDPAAKQNKFKIVTPLRYKSQKGSLSNAELDIQAAISSPIAVFSGDAIEMDAGSSALMGLRRSLSLTSIFQYTSSIMFKGAGGQQMRVNLMIDQGAEIITTSTSETIHQLELFFTSKHDHKN